MALALALSLVIASAPSWGISSETQSEQSLASASAPTSAMVSALAWVRASAEPWAGESVLESVPMLVQMLAATSVDKLDLASEQASKLQSLVASSLEAKSLEAKSSLESSLDTAVGALLA